MIYQNYNFTESYSNASGSKQENMAVSELGKVIAQSPSAVKSALSSAGVKIPHNPSKKGLIRIIIKNRNNRGMVKNLSALVFASTKFDEKDNNFLNMTLAPRGATEISSSTSSGTQLAGATTEKKGLFKSIGGFFKGLGAKSKQRASDPKVQERRKKWGSWFQQNKGTIGNIAGSLFGGLSSGSSANTTMKNQAYNTNNQLRQDDDPKGLSLGAKIGIGVGILAVVGTIIYFATRKK